MDHPRVKGDPCNTDFKDSVIKPMIFNDIVVDETFGAVQNKASLNGTEWREFSFTAPVSGFYRFELNLQQNTQADFQNDAFIQ